jgi:hypothetical protein
MPLEMEWSQRLFDLPHELQFLAVKPFPNRGGTSRRSNDGRWNVCHEHDLHVTWDTVFRPNSPELSPAVLFCPPSFHHVHWFIPVVVRSTIDLDT